MSDWLTKLHTQRNKEDAEKKAAAFAAQLAEKERDDEIRRSYLRNKPRYEAIYDSVDRYAKRAVDMGFDVRTGRTGDCLSIYGTFPIYEGTGSCQLVLTPTGRGFIVHYIGRVNTNPKQRFSFWRVTDRTVANWVKWAVGQGDSDPKENFWFKIVLCGIGLGIIGFILLVILVTNGWISF